MPPSFHGLGQERSVFKKKNHSPGQGIFCLFWIAGDQVHISHNWGEERKEVSLGSTKLSVVQQLWETPADCFRREYSGTPAILDLRLTLEIDLFVLPPNRILDIF